MAANAGHMTESFVVELHENDVLMGRGSPSAEYPGNMRFRQLVTDRRTEYLKCNRREDKHRIAMEIIDTIHERGGHFLQRITTMEEAERLKVPPRTQAWKVMQKTSSYLSVKVKQLMRDVGEDTQQKRKLRREEKRQEKKKEALQASSAGEDKSHPKRMKGGGKDDRIPRHGAPFPPAQVSDQSSECLAQSSLSGESMSGPTRTTKRKASRRSNESSDDRPYKKQTGGSLPPPPRLQPMDQYNSDNQSSMLTRITDQTTVNTSSSVATSPTASLNAPELPIALLNALLQPQVVQQPIPLHSYQQSQNIINVLQGSLATQRNSVSSRPDDVLNVLLSLLTAQQQQSYPSQPTPRPTPPPPPPPPQTTSIEDILRAALSSQQQHTPPSPAYAPARAQASVQPNCDGNGNGSSRQTDLGLLSLILALSRRS